MKNLKPGKTNAEERMHFVEYWAEYVRTHPDEVWSKQQKVLIDSQMQNAKNNALSPKQYLKMKNELKHINKK